MNKTLTIPNEWHQARLGDIATPIHESVGNRSIETLSISAGKGFVNQAEKFGRELSGNQYVNYTVLRKGDFSFNKGNSKRYPYGCIYLLKDRDIAAVPNVFYSFRIEGQYPEYFEQLFINGGLNHQLSKLINAGVRNDGLFNLYEEDFYNCMIMIPPLCEQRAIAKILTAADKIIATKERLIAAKRKQKKWLMQNLMTGKKRMPGFNGAWVRERLGNIGKICMCKRVFNNQTSTDGDVPFYKIGTFGGKADAFIQQKLFNEYIEKYSFPKKGDVLISAAGTIGRIVIYDGKPAYFQDSNIVWLENNEYKVLNMFLYYFYAQGKWEKTEGGSVARLYNDNIRNKKISVPSIIEQQAIAEILITADREIELLQKDLEQHKLYKKYLMQQLLTGKIRVKGEID